jgi:hypothetical protein
MKKMILTVTVLIVVVGARWAVPVESKAGQSSIVARMTLANGSSRTVTLEGVGCSKAMCSRVAIQGKASGDSRVTRTWLDTIATIKDISSEDALFVLKNGTARRLSVVHDNRFLYFADQNGVGGKIDLAGVKSVEFLAAGR